MYNERLKFHKSRFTNFEPTAPNNVKVNFTLFSVNHQTMKKLEGCR